MSSAIDRCMICGGTREEHSELTRHVFTDVAGDLRLRPSVTERQPMKEPNADISVVSRLIEIMVDKDLLTAREAFLCFGIKVEHPEGAADDNSNADRRTD